MSGRACAPQNAHARALLATMAGCRETSGWSRGTRAELRERRFEGRTPWMTTSLAPVFATVVVAALARRSKFWSSWTSLRSSPPPQGRVGPNCENQARLEGTADRLLEAEPAPRRSPGAQVDELNTQGWPSLCPPAQRYAREPRPFMDKPADARRKPRSSARRKVRQGRFLKTRTRVGELSGPLPTRKHRPRPLHHVDGSRDRIFLLARRVHDLQDRKRKSRPILKSLT